MAAISSCHCSLLYTTTTTCSSLISPKLIANCISFTHTAASNRRFRIRCSSNKPRPCHLHNQQEDRFFALKECAISFALAVGLITGVPTLGCPTFANAITPALPDLSVLISGPPIKDPGALLRYALPIDNKTVREVQKPLEEITDSLKVAGVKGLDSVERNVRQASRTLKEGKSSIISGLAELKKDHGIELLDKLEVGMQELEKIVESKNREAVAPKQKELLEYVGG